MDEACFQDLVDRFGDDLATWPPAESETARALLARSASARAILEDANELRRVFAGLPQPAAPAGLTARLLALTELGDEAAKSEAAPW